MIKRLFSLVIAAALFCSNASALVSTTYLFAGTHSTYKNNITRTNGNLTTVCPDYFELTDAGLLKLSRTVDRDFLSELKESGVAVTPFLANHWDRERARKGLAMRHALAQSISALVEDYGFDGVDIDLENINEEDREAFTDFIRLLRESLEKGRSLTVCVPANPSGWTKGWHGAYDYAKLASYADYLFIMAYDEHYEGGPPGAVASLGFAEKSVKYALTKTAAEKIVLGVPFYGRYWRQGADTGGAALTNSNIGTLTELYGAATWYDEEARCARALIAVPNGEQTEKLWGGKQISEGLYDIWYENDRSLKEKLALVKKYGIRGAGSWALGQEPKEIWGSYRSWLQGPPPSDIGGLPAGDETVPPNDSGVVKEPEGLPFSDIGGHWAESDIMRLYEAGIVKGRGAGQFFPNSSITRAETAALFLKLMNVTPSGASGAFPDTGSHWAAAEIAEAKRLGLAKGLEDGLFHPDEPVTREQFAVFADRYSYLPDTVDFGEKRYEDVSPGLSPWSNNAIIKLSLAGVFSGKSEGRFFPKDSITRAEAAKTLYRLSALPARLRVIDGKTIEAKDYPPINPR